MSATPPAAASTVDFALHQQRPRRRRVGLRARSHGRRSARPSARRTARAAGSRAGVGADRPVIATSAPSRRPSHPASELREHDAASCARRQRSRAATARSSNACARRRFPGRARGPCRRPGSTSSGPAAASACAMARRGRAAPTTREASAKPARMSATMASPSSLRGLSSVTMTVSAQALGDRRHLRALAAVAFAAAAEHAGQARRRCARAALASACSSASGRVRVVDHHQRQAVARRRGGSCGRRPAPAASSIGDSRQRHAQRAAARRPRPAGCRR